MKKRIFIVCYLLGILLTGCTPSLPADDPPEEVSAYSSNSPQEDVPYYEDIKGSSLSGDIPENLMTVSKAQEMFGGIGFSDYAKENVDTATSYTATTEASTLSLKADDNEVVTNIKFTTKMKPLENALKEINCFLSVASGQDLSPEEQTSIKEIFSDTQKENTDVNSVKLNDQVFLLWADTKNQQYSVIWE